MTTSELGPVEREQQLAVLWGRMGKAARRGHMGRYEELKAEHDRLKAEHVVRSHEEQREAARARRAQQRAEEERVRPARWRLPAGFGVSPMAAQRAREGRPEVPVVPVGRPVLSPWRRGSPMAEQIWRPGS